MKKSERQTKLEGTYRKDRHGDGKRDITIFQGEVITIDPRESWQDETKSHFLFFSETQKAIGIISPQDIASILAVWDLYDDYVRMRKSIDKLRKLKRLDEDDERKLERLEDRSHKVGIKYVENIKAFGVSPEGRMKLLSVLSDAERRAHKKDAKKDDPIMAEIVK